MHEFWMLEFRNIRAGTKVRVCCIWGVDDDEISGGCCGMQEV